MPVSDPSLDAQKVLSPNKERPETRLPPPGDQRREQLKKELDALNARAEAIASQLGIERADPTRVKPDHDAQVAAAKLALPVDPNAEVGIAGLRKDRQYVCVWGDPFGRLANRIFFSYKREGWEPVQAGMPEWDANPEAQKADNCLHYADCILMWMPRERYAALERKRHALRIAREEGVPAALLELADRAGTKASYGELPTEGGPDSIAAQAMRSANMHTAARQGMAVQIAQRKFDEALRAGSLHRR